ncbi:MAG: hypothetical protein JXQ96_07735 [Cyclobacteriaceae bacterium]
MSDLEFDVLDELYFVIHYKDLSQVTQLDDEDLKPLLTKMYSKGWLRCYNEPDEELEGESVDIEVNYRNYYYLASKEGLKMHNKN